MVSGKGVTQAIREISLHFPDQYKLNQHLRYLATRVLFPFAIGALVLGVVFQILALLYRYWYPPTAAQLHRYVRADRFEQPRNNNETGSHPAEESECYAIVLLSSEYSFSYTIVKNVRFVCNCSFFLSFPIHFLSISGLSLFLSARLLLPQPIRLHTLGSLCIRQTSTFMLERG